MKMEMVVHEGDREGKGCQKRDQRREKKREGAKMSPLQGPWGEGCHVNLALLSKLNKSKKKKSPG